MKLKDKIQIYMKNNKEISLKKSIIITGVLFIMLLSTGYIRNNKSYNNSYSLNKEDNLFKATFVGDIMMTRSIEQVGERKGYEYFFENVSHLWKNSDYVLGNLENAVLEIDESNYNKADKEIHLATKPKAVDAIKDSGFDIVSLANNHTADYSREGVLSTINVLKDIDIKYIGAGENIKEAIKYDITEVNGIKIATIAISDVVPRSASATSEQPGILSTYYDGYIEIINKASKETDITIVVSHWGEEYTLESASNRQSELAKSFINAGADIVIGGHPHVLQPIELYKDGIIFYSLGNFIFDQGFSRTKDSMVVNYTIDSNGDGQFEIIPIRINEGKPCVTDNKFYIQRSFKLLTKLLDRSKYTIENNKLIVKSTSVDLDSIRNTELYNELNS
ncbi:Capsule biosynthesis protein CapA [Romboutsia ilealis]|uniref:Capsule biosynthesis protein CapA n=1 Tax=Romboutsia ilealis TaxID=1115758 RepID=A0A1V1HYC3_9FIRM|nr:CapA family protein [Romboutsia ilealis]CED92970.1 Capsule biosynthesis protein CapA [Romboutsia ilealis]